MDFRDRTNRILNHAKKNFGECCTLYPASGDPITFTGIFNNNVSFVDADTEQRVTSTMPTLGVNLFDFQIEIQTSFQVQVRNLRYKINDIQEDGQGGATLVLHQIDHEQKVFKKKSN